MPGKDLLVLGHGTNDSTDNFEELMLFVRAPLPSARPI